MVQIKIDQEYDELVEDLKKSKPEIIIEPNEETMNIAKEKINSYLNLTKKEKTI